MITKQFFPAQILNCFSKPRHQSLRQIRSSEYNACLNMLGILDAHISHVMTKDNQGNQIQVDRQHTTPAEARKCHNELLLTIDNQTILAIFLKMMVGKSENLIVDLDGIRKLVREELGFGSDYRPDEENTWLASIKCKNNG